MSVLALARSLPTSSIGGLILIAMGLAIFIVGALRGPALLRSAGLMLVLVGFFVAFAASLWILDPESPFTTALFLLGSVATFKLMAAFEQPPRNPPAPS